MLTILNLAKNLWKKNMVSNIMVMIILCLACLVTNVTYNILHQMYYDYDFFKDTPLNNSLMYMGGARDENGNLKAEDVEKMNAVAKDNEDIIEGISKMMNFSCYSADHADGSFYVFDQITASYMKKGIQGEGEWLFDSAEKDGYYPIVVFNGELTPKYDMDGNLIADKNGRPVYFPKYDDTGEVIKDSEGYPVDFPLYKLGETVELDVSAYMHVQQIGKIIPPKEMTLKCKVVGIIDSIEPFTFFLGNQYGTLTNDVRNTFSLSDSRERTCIFFPYNEELFGDFDFCNGTALYYFKNNAPVERIQAFCADAKAAGFCTLGSDIIQKTKDVADNEFNNEFFLCYTLAGLSLISIICVSFLNIRKLTKQIAIYRLNGCGFMKSVIIYFTYFAVMYGISFMMFLGVLLIIKFCLSGNDIKGFLTVYTTNFTTAAVIFLVGLAVSAIASLIPFIFIKKKTPIENLKVG